MHSPHGTRVPGFKPCFIVLQITFFFFIALPTSDTQRRNLTGFSAGEVCAFLVGAPSRVSRHPLREASTGTAVYWALAMKHLTELVGLVQTAKLVQSSGKHRTVTSSILNKGREQTMSQPVPKSLVGNIG